MGFDHLRWMPPAQPLPDEWLVRRLERAPLGTPYTKIVERMAELTEHPKLRGNCRLVVDATGLGAPVVDMLLAARLECDVIPVVLTGGSRKSICWRGRPPWPLARRCSGQILNIDGWRVCRPGG